MAWSRSLHQAFAAARPGWRAAVALTALAAALAARRALMRLQRYEVAGESMAPSLLPGDYLLVDTGAYRRDPPAPGQVVVVRDPRDCHRMLVKRVTGISEEGDLWLAGDNAERSTDSRTFGAVAQEALLGRVILRYWPPARAQLAAALPSAGHQPE